MSSTERCDEILRLIDEALAEAAERTLRPALATVRVPTPPPTRGPGLRMWWR